MPADSWEAWDREDFDKEELKFLKELELWAEYAADEEIEVSPGFRDRLMASLREKQDLLINNQELGLVRDGDDFTSTRPSLPISMLNVGESYQTCRQSGCGYQVKLSDEFCPNCGIISPYGVPEFTTSRLYEYMNNENAKYVLTTAFSFIYLIVISSILSSSHKITTISYFWLMPLLFASLYMFYAFYLLSDGIVNKASNIEGYKREKFYKRHEVSREFCMINREEVITEYLKNLDVQEAKIKKRLEETPYEISQQTLRAALNKIPTIRWQCQDKLCAIELIRWHNRAARVYENSLNLSESAYTFKIEQSTRVREEGGEMLDRWEESYSDQMESTERLGRALDICRRFHRDLTILRDEVIAGQIINMEEELARFEHSADYNERRTEIDAFILISDFDDFQERLELEELNKEFNRLLSEYS